jgi:glucose/arabinose dehydrogenase
MIRSSVGADLVSALIFGRHKVGRYHLVRTVLVLMLPGCAQAQGPAPRSPQPGYASGVVRAEEVAGGLVNPWALEFMPDGRLLVTERPGRLRIVSMDGTVSAPIAGLPPIAVRGQGGLLDVALDPRFAENRIIYLSFSEPGDSGLSGTAVARARLGDGRLEDLRIIYSQRPKVNAAQHFGSRLVFGRDGTLFVTQGDRGSYRHLVQSLSTGVGKIMRINTDGTIPRDNPFVGRDSVQPAIWSYGHRNAQAAALEPGTGQLWTVEHGARGGDELNHPQAGRNYGWPEITYGVDYSGARVGTGVEREGMEQPVYYWDPVIAPSGMTFYTGNRYPGWQNSVLVGGMASMALVRLVLENGRVTREERYLGELRERVRDVQQGPDGLLYIVTDHTQGRVMRIVPVSR